MPFVTSAEAMIHAAVNGVDHLPKVRSWTSFDGGDAQAATKPLLPGGMGKAVAVPGPVTRTNVTVKRPYHTELHPHVAKLENSINQKMQASFTPIDPDGNPLGSPIVRVGLLKEVQVPNFDAKGEEAYLGLVMECDT